jgi:Ca2+-binding RTX toxin-like protein
MGSGDDTLRLDDVANDGSVGEAKNVHTDVEVIDGAPGSDKLFGHAGANRLLGGPGNDLINSGGGPDVIEGGRGGDDLRGGPGLDRVAYSNPAGQTITLNDVRDDGAPGELDSMHADVEDVAAGPGDDTVIGGQAANFLDGGEGNDGLEGLGGVDAYFGGPGTDALFARDGIGERVQCGPEPDSVEADAIDLLADCEISLPSSAVFQAPTPTITGPGDCHDQAAAIGPGSLTERTLRPMPDPLAGLQSTWVLALQRLAGNRAGNGIAAGSYAAAGRRRATTHPPKQAPRRW